MSETKSYKGSCFCHCDSCRHWSAGPVNAFTLWKPDAVGFTDVYAAILPRLALKPGLHVFYEETVLHIRDGLPKQKDVPKELGGSGVALAE